MLFKHLTPFKWNLKTYYVKHEKEEGSGLVEIGDGWRKKTGMGTYCWGHLWHYLENSMDRGAWRAKVHGVARSQTWLSKLWQWGQKGGALEEMMNLRFLVCVLGWMKSKAIFISIISCRRVGSTYSPQQLNKGKTMQCFCKVTSEHVHWEGFTQGAVVFSMRRWNEALFK